MRFGFAHHKPDVVRECGDTGEVDGAVLRWEDHNVLRRERLRRDPSTARLDVRYAHGEKHRAAAPRMTECTGASGRGCGGVRAGLSSEEKQSGGAKRHPTRGGVARGELMGEMMSAWNRVEGEIEEKSPPSPTEPG